MKRARTVVILLLAALAARAAVGEARRPATTGLRFEVVVGKGLLARPTDGRVLVALGKSARVEPRLAIGATSATAPPMLGKDGNRLSTGSKVVLDEQCAIYPLERLADLPAGEYQAQAVFDYHPDLRLPDAPGNLVSEVTKVTLDPKKGGTVTLTLSRKLPDEKLPADTATVKYLKFKSEKLTKFHGRPMYLRAGVVLPPGHARDRDKKYPLRVNIGGFGTRFTAVGGMAPMEGMLILQLDGAGPLGDPYQVNSANHGPYGDAITQELIPHVEKQYRGIGAGYARVLEGASTGGWVSLALQVFYPDYFNGCWSHCPDPVDFRAFQVVDVYREKNLYVNAFGFERPAARRLNGDVWFTVRHEVAKERVLGRGDHWALSGKDWGSWNATFSPRGKDGLPAPAWDARTGKLDVEVIKHWAKYDLRAHLEKNWEKLGPQLRGKIHVWVGEADEYFLNNAVYLLEAFFQKAKPAYEGKITYGARQGHSWRGLTAKQMREQMLQAVERGRKAAR